MSHPIGFRLPPGLGLVDLDALELVTTGAREYVKGLHRHGVAVNADMLTAIEGFGGVTGGGGVAQVGEGVAVLANVEEPPAHWITSDAASEMAGVSPQALSKRLTSDPPTLIGCKWRGRNYYDPE